MRVLIVVIMGRWSEFSACIVCQVVRLYGVVEIVVMFGEVACCSVVCGTLVGVSVFSNHHHRSVIKPFLNSSVHCFPTSLNIIRSSKEQGYESWEHCNMCAMVSSALPPAHVVSPA